MPLSVDIKKRLGSFALDVSFEAGDEVLALLGASGCGKSMTLKCIAGIEKPDEGRIVLNGRVLFDSARHIDLAPQQRRVGYLFQQYALFPNMTVRDNIAAGVRRENRARKDELVDAYLSAMKLGDARHKRPCELSGGQQQRAALARILVNEPELILLDEPFSALDSYLKWQVEMELADTLEGFGGSAVFVSHDRDEVYRLCDSVCILTEGKSEEKASVDAVFRAPRTLAACRMTGCKNFSRIVRLDGSRALAQDWGIELEGLNIPPAAVWAGIRSHDIRPGDGKNAIDCRAERRVEELFSDVLMLSTPGGGKIRMESPRGELSDIRPGDEIEVHIQPENIMFLEE